MFPGAGSQATVHRASHPAIGARLEGRQPGIHHQAGARIQLERLAGGVGRVQGVEEGGGRDLGRLLAGRVHDPRSPSHGRGHGIRGHSIVGRHDFGGGGMLTLPGALEAGGWWFRARTAEASSVPWVNSALIEALSRVVEGPAGVRRAGCRGGRREGTRRGRARDSGTSGGVWKSESRGRASGVKGKGASEWKRRHEGSPKSVTKEARDQQTNEPKGRSGEGEEENNERWRERMEDNRTPEAGDVLDGLELTVWHIRIPGHTRAVPDTRWGRSRFTAGMGGW